MKLPKLLMLILLLPALVALGYDLYLFYQEANPNQPIDSSLFAEKFQLSDLGFIIAQQSPQTLSWIAQTIPEAQLVFIEILLHMKAVFVGLIFSGIFISIFIVMSWFGKGPFSAKEK